LNADALFVLHFNCNFGFDNSGRYEAELAQASALPLPDDDDEAFES
jgi:hypothetical protein